MVRGYDERQYENLAKILPRHLILQRYLWLRTIRDSSGEKIILKLIQICVLINSATRMFNVEIENFHNTIGGKKN